MTSASSTPASANRSGLLRRISGILLRLAGHLLVLLLVILFPLVVYELVALSSLREQHVLLMSGAVSWPLYGLWLSRRIRHERVRFVLRQLILLLTVIGLMALFASCSASAALMWLVRGLPLLAAVTPLPLLFEPAMRRSSGFAGHWKGGALLCLPLALAFALLMTHATTLCTPGGLHE
ncbi:hypothetical protein ACFONG_04150 [Uliginosibacterium paludis]|uniref:Uncharacterized protein n=1 Tax=Uliginosibacterium paludis TaxID=1615952 RepID=A0ABV2CPL5_9RHOO